MGIPFSTHVFDPEVLQRVAREAVAKKLPKRELFEHVAAELATLYPGHINTDWEWVFNNAGGAMGAMMVLHCSLSEYVIIFGTAVGTEGHSGRFFADDYFTILHGEQWTYNAGDVCRQVYKPGDQNHLPRGQCFQYRMPDECWALEYARGNIPLMLPFGMADMFLSTLDLPSIAHTIWIYCKRAIPELLQGKL